MARLTFTGPEKLKGLDIPLVKPGRGRIKDLVDLQRATGMTIPEIQEDSKNVESFGFLVVLFGSLRAAGIPVTWSEVEEFEEAWVELVKEPGDDRSAEGTEPDPTSAPTASAPAAVEGSAPRPSSGAGKRKKPSHGSKTRSAGA